MNVNNYNISLGYRSQMKIKNYFNKNSKFEERGAFYAKKYQSKA